MPNADSDRRDLAIANPNPGETFAPCPDNFVAREKFDQRLFEPAQIAMQILAAPAKIDNRVTHQLTGTVIGRLPAAIDREQRMRQMRCA